MAKSFEQLLADHTPGGPRAVVMTAEHMLAAQHMAEVAHRRWLEDLAATLSDPSIVDVARAIPFPKVGV